VYVYGSLVTGDYSSAADPEPLRTYWFGDRMTQWQMKLLTQAEVISAGVAAPGFPPAPADPRPACPLHHASRRRPAQPMAGKKPRPGQLTGPGRWQLAA
jgi:hypothetical protein